MLMLIVDADAFHLLIFALMLIIFAFAFIICHAAICFLLIRCAADFRAFRAVTLIDAYLLLLILLYAFHYAARCHARLCFS